jgi:putative redox protein
MVPVKEKTVVTQRVHGDCPTHSRTDISTRDVRTIIDEPRERDGTNMGPTPTETLIASLIACTNVISHKCAHKHGVDFKSMSIDAESSFDRRGTQLSEEIEVPFAVAAQRLVKKGYMRGGAMRKKAAARRTPKSLQRRGYPRHKR